MDLSVFDIQYYLQFLYLRKYLLTEVENSELVENYEMIYFATVDGNLKKLANDVYYESYNCFCLYI